MLNFLLILSLIQTFPLIYCETVGQAELVSSININATIPVIDTEFGDDNILDCPIDRNRWPFPSILQWFRSKNNYSSPVASQFDDFPVHIDEAYIERFSLLTNGSLKIVNSHLSDNDTYQCRLILIDRGLLDTKESFFITLRVNEPPRLINHSESLRIALRYSTVEFFCHTYAVPYPTVKWLKIKANKSSEDFLVRNQHLILQNVNDRSAGKYKCIGENKLGSVEHEFKLLIRGSIYWLQYPKNQTVKIHGNLTLNCEGESSEPLQYQWLKDNLPLSETMPENDRIRTYSDGMLMINDIQPSDHGSYICVISIVNGTSVRSKPVIITVRYPPFPSLNRPTKNITLIRDSPGICPCLLDAYPPIESVSWYRNGKAVRLEAEGVNYGINADYSLVIKMTSGKDAGEYFCRAQNAEGFGRESIKFHVQVKDPIHLIQKPNATYFVEENDDLVLPCLAQGHPTPYIKWLKNSVEVRSMNNDALILENISKTDHGLYVCQASNPYTSVNTSTLIIVRNTTPQAPYDIQYNQKSTSLHVSWQPGYDGGHEQYFYLWYRMVQKKKQNWKQLLVLPLNATEIVLFDLKLGEKYEILVVGENQLGLGTFSIIKSIPMIPIDDLTIDYLDLFNETVFARPSPPTNLHLSQAGSNLHITWQHPTTAHGTSRSEIAYYVLQWRSSIFFNNHHSHKSLVINYPIHSYVLRDIKQSKYTIQILSYTHQGIYSTINEKEIEIQFHPILMLYGSNSLWISVISFVTVFFMAMICTVTFLAIRYQTHRRFYWMNLDSAQNFSSCCFTSIHYKPGDCSHLHNDRCHANLLKSNDLPPSPLYLARRIRKPENNNLEPSQSLRTSIKSAPIETSIPSATRSLLHESPPKLVSTAINSTETSNALKKCSIDHMGNHVELEIRRSILRPPLEVVPEMNELTINHEQNKQPSLTAGSSTVENPAHPMPLHPVLTTFDSNSIQRRR